jgi:hypothetical protein
MKRRTIWFAAALVALVATLWHWLNAPGFVAWFSGVTALAGVAVAIWYERHPKMDAAFLGILAVVPALLSAVIALGQWQVVGTSGPEAAVPGLVGLLIWWTRPRNA